MNKALKRFIIAGAAITTGLVGGLYEASQHFIRHEQLPLVDSARNDRSVPVDVYVRRDKEMRATLGTIDPLPVVIINHGNTVKSSEYSFAAKFFAGLGYLVLSIQHDVPGDPPLAAPAERGTSYITRWSSYMKGSANIDFVVDTLKKQEPFADYDHLTLLGHSQGGDIAVFYTKSHPNTVVRVFTFDNLRIPLEGETETFSIRGLDENDFKTEKGVLPCTAPCEKGNVTIGKSDSHHTTLSDRGPEGVRERLLGSIAEFLKRPLRKNPGPAINPGPPVPY